MRPPPVYSEKDMREANERLAAVDTRSIKKVAEAKFRKKKRAETKMAQARKCASTIMEQYDVPDRGEFFDEESVALDLLARGVANTLVTSIFEGF